MAIEFYPSSDIKRKKHVVDQLQEPSIFYNAFDSNNLNGTPVDAIVWFPGSWEIRRIALHYSTNAAKTYSVALVRGRGVVSGKNDMLFFKVDGYPPQEIILSQGFYTGAQLATHLKTKLDANSDFISAGAAPFTVSYDSATGLFSISANGGMLLDYYYRASSLRRLENYSSAGKLFGLGQDSGKVATVQSSTPVKNIGVEVDYVAATGSATQNVLATDVLAMTSDDALAIHMGAVNAIGDYEVVFRVLDW